MISTKLIEKEFKKIVLMTVACLAMLTSFTSCEKEEPDEEEPEEVVVQVPNMPSSYNGRAVNDLGTIEVGTKNVTFKVWDGGALVDGDIITLVVNGVKVVNQYELLGPSSKLSVPVTLNNLGYNYVLLYAHNEGTSPPNTASLSVVDGTGTVQNLVLSSNLQTNGAYNIIVK